MPAAIVTRPITLGASYLGRRDERDPLADALLASPIGNLDTSNNYGHGQSEALLGAAIRRAGGLPEGKLIYSKADSGDDGVFDGDRVRRSLDESLTRLGLDHLPLYQLHDPYTITFEEAMSPGGAVPALLALRDEGLIGAIGIACAISHIHRYVATGLFDAVLLHNRLTLVDRTGAPTFELARSLGMTVFNAAPFGGGTLANGSTRYEYHEMSPEFAGHVDLVRALAREWGVDLAAAALHFSIRSPLVDSTVVGVSSVRRLEQLGDLLETDVPDAFFDSVDALGDPPDSGAD